MLGYTIEQLEGRQVFDLYADTPHGKPKAGQVFQRFLAGERVAGEELQMIKADGTLIWISLSVTGVLDLEGKVVESRSTVIDITERAMDEEPTMRRYPIHPPKQTPPSCHPAYLSGYLRIWNHSWVWMGGFILS